jgi:2-methylcitrate dehydratase PrpD
VTSDEGSCVKLPTAIDLTEQACRFVEALEFSRIPAEAVRIGKRCIADTLGLFVAGIDESSVAILCAVAAEQGGAEEAILLGAGRRKVPAALAARVLGTAGHAHDWDDTQVSHDRTHVYGLLTHPTVPPLAAAIVTAQKVGAVSGRAFMTAFLAGFEVECKISEWMRPDHYQRGHHSSGTVGTFGAAVAAAKLLGLGGPRLLSCLGMAASFAAGIRCNFGTMTKPLHVGRAAENGVTAAILASKGFEADPDALDGRWGFAQVTAGGYDEAKLSQGFGRTWSIVEPGVSIKPYPSGILTHQAMDAMLKLVTDHDLRPEQAKTIRFCAGKNILEPIRYPFAENHLQAKFSMAALLSMMVLSRRAGRLEFSDAYIRSAAFADMQRRIVVVNDPAIDAMGYDRIRSRIEVLTQDGRTLVQWADERYRGGPMLPMSDREVEDKFAACTAGLINTDRQRRLLDLAWSADELPDARDIADALALDLPMR